MTRLRQMSAKQRTSYSSSLSRLLKFERRPLRTHTGKPPAYVAAISKATTEIHTRMRDSCSWIQRRTISKSSLSGPIEFLLDAVSEHQRAEPGARANTRDWGHSTSPKLLAAC